jgi:hypothetical protein
MGFENPMPLSLLLFPRFLYIRNLNAMYRIPDRDTQVQTSYIVDLSPDIIRMQGDISQSWFFHAFGLLL